MTHRLIFVVTFIPMFFISLVWWVITGKNIYIQYCDYYDEKFAEQKSKFKNNHL